MAIEIKIPRLGWSMDEGIFAGWLKHDGEPVRAGDPLFSLEGEKATQDVEAIDDGTLSIPSNAPVAGEKVAVGTVVGYLLRAGESIPGRKDETSSQPNASPTGTDLALRNREEPLGGQPISSPLAGGGSRARHRLDPTSWQWHNGPDQESRRPRGRSNEAKSSAASLLSALRQPDAPDHRRADDRKLPHDGPGDLVNHDRRDESRRSSSPVQGR